MTITSEAEIRELSVADRLRLIDLIWDTLAPDEIPVSEKQRRELERRIEAHRRDPLAGATWQEVKERLRK